MAPHTTEPDPWISRMVVLGIINVALCSIAGAVVLDAMDKPITPGLIAIASACVGFLGGLLIPRPRISNGQVSTNQPQAGVILDPTATLPPANSASPK